MFVSEWNHTTSDAGKVSLVLIYSWNEYHERTAIEPHIDATSAAPDYLFNQAGHYISKLG